MILTFVCSFLVTSMGLLIPWSCFLAVVDVYSLFLGCPLRLPGAIILIIVGDWVRIFINYVYIFN